MKSIIAIAFIIAMIGCSDEDLGIARDNVPIPTSATMIKVVVIDSCEYLIWTSDLQSYSSHKGNCKYCAQRNTSIK